MKQGWEIKKLGDITTSINGLWTGKKPPFTTIAVIRNTNFTKDCKLDTSDIAYIDVEVKQYASRKLQCGDIIIEKSGGSDKQPVGRPILFNIEEGEYSFSNFTSTLRVSDKTTILPEFIHRYLAYIYMRGDTAAMQSKTTGIRNLDFTLYKSIQVPIPPREEQERIVEELDCLSGVIERKREQLRELDALAQSIFYQMFGDPITNEKGWEVKKLKNITSKIGSGATPKGGNESYKQDGISLIRSLNVHNNLFVYKDLAYIDD
jgi:type I restriction enzyme S subunit